MQSQVVKIGNFFKMGWDLACKEDTGTRQQIIKKLANEEALAIIKALADEQAGSTVFANDLVLESQCLCQDFPGALSELGPHHDTDHADIFDIKILPTTDELQSPRSEYLPSNDPKKHHFPGLAGLLDRQCRLLREDTVGQLRDAVQFECKRLTQPANVQSPPKRPNNGVRNTIHLNVALLRLELDRKRGLQVVAEFDQPPAVAKKGAKEREDWWRNSKQLQIHAFVCLASSTGRAIFFSVCDPTPTPRPKRKNGEEEHQVGSTE
ncbi:MAG: hypothetical protein Q9173_002776 [Seirophora scorigena]